MELSAKSPLSGGPTAHPTPVIKTIVAKKSGIFFFETTWQIIMNPPRLVPACAKPWMARPTIRTWDVDDVAQTADPESDCQPNSTCDNPADTMKQTRTNDVNKNAGAVGDLQWKQRVHPSKDRQEGEPGKIMRGLVPRRLAKTVELGCDLGDCSHQQLLVQFPEECADHQCDGHENQPAPCDLLATAGEECLQENTHTLDASPDVGSDSWFPRWWWVVRIEVVVHGLTSAARITVEIVGRWRNEER